MTTGQLIVKLNEDLANEYAAILQYTTYAARVTGPSSSTCGVFPCGSVR